MLDFEKILDHAKSFIKNLTDQVSIKPSADELQVIEKALVGIISSVKQVSDKHARIFSKVIIGKIGAAASLGGLTGLISTFGAASTGASIASLSGAAATSAKLYWVGSIIGLGAASGGIMLAAAGLGAGVVAARYGRQWILGEERSDDELYDHERALLCATMTLLQAIREQIKTGKQPTRKEMEIISYTVLAPLVRQIEENWTRIAHLTNPREEAHPLKEVLSPFNRMKIVRSKNQLSEILTRRQNRWYVL
jgi:hypothetical protein